LLTFEEWSVKQLETFKTKTVDELKVEFDAADADTSTFLNFEEYKALR
jgi:hypothetical protein